MLSKGDLPHLLEGNYRNWADLAAYREEADQFRRRLTLLQKSNNTGGVSLFSVMRNEAALLPQFLSHYRRLGVARFVIVDNDSTDASRELLSRQPDVDLYHTAEGYAAANGGTLWLDGLMHEQARGEWVLNVDADELLVYEQCDKYPLPDLVRRLAATGQKSLLAPLIDLYPNPASTEEVYFDAVPDFVKDTNFEGGPRYRMAVLHGHQTYPCLTKYPLVQYGLCTAYANVHFPYPRRRSRPRLWGRLLHLKLTTQFKTRVEEALREGQHWNGGAEYQIYAKWLGGREIGDLRTPESRRYSGPQDLIAAGLLEPLDWQRSNTSLRIKWAVRRLWRSHR